MKIYINRKTRLKEIIIPGVLKSLRNTTLETKGVNKKKYRYGEVQITHPNKTKVIVDSIIFESTLNYNPEFFFKENSNVYLIVQTEGKYKGCSTIIQPSLLKDEIIRIYIGGLPIDIQNKVLWVKDEYRTNYLSLIPGGTDVIIEYKSEKVLGYDKIKEPNLYIENILEKYFALDQIDFKNLKRDKKLYLIKNHINRIFGREYKTEEEFRSTSFKELWNTKTHNNLPNEIFI